MQKRNFGILAFVATCTLLISCGRTYDANGRKTGSKLHFITVGPGVKGLNSVVKQSEIKVCLSGSTGGNTEKWKQNIQKAILTWVQPLRMLTSDLLAQSVAVVSGGNDCDGSVIVTPGQWAMTDIGDNPTVNLDSSGYFASYNVLLHEFGHAFALGDTYQGGQSGNCQAGQPQAVMCNTSFSELQPDDIKGVQKIYKNAFPNDQPGNGGGTPPNIPITVQPAIFAAIDGDALQSSFKLMIAVNETTAPTVTEVSYCTGLKSDCENNGNWLPTSKVPAPSSNAAAGFFSTSGFINPEQTQNCTIRAKTSSGLVYRSIRFRKP